jgi:hypothetical protein
MRTMLSFEMTFVLGWKIWAIEGFRVRGSGFRGQGSGQRHGLTWTLD